MTTSSKPQNTSSKEEEKRTESFISLIGDKHDVSFFKEQYWEGSLEDYFEIVRKNPKVARSAFQRIYDMIMSYGTEDIIEQKEKYTRYKFFDDERTDGEDAIFGLDKSLMKLLNIFKSAANRYGTEKRVLLLHGPVGGCKSTIVRLLKKGLEEYSRTEEGALYTFSWNMPDEGEVKDAGSSKTIEWMDCPMHEDPLHLVDRKSVV